MRLHGGGTALKKNEAAFCEVGSVRERSAESREHGNGTRMM